jgi:CheY-like chemotaxis protein
MSPEYPESLLRVLVVEDESFVRMVAVAMLEEVGLAVAEAPDAEAALTLLQASPEAFGVLFTDIDMPGAMNGLALAEEVHQRWPHIRLVVTSGRVLPRKSDIPDAGRFLRKPYHRGALLAALDQAA